MTVCPKCGKQIYHLRNYVLMWRELRFMVKDGAPLHEPSGDIILSEPIQEEYRCPDCDMLLFKADSSKDVDRVEKLAADFLSGKG